VVTIACGPLVLPVEGDAAVICRKRSGVVVIRDACKAKETSVDLSQFGALGPEGPRGPQGVPGAAGSAKAYGQFGFDATFVPQRSFNVLSVARPVGEPTGVYCVTLAPTIDLSTTAPIASVEWGNSIGEDLLVEPVAEAFACPMGTVEVRTFRLPGGVATLSNDVAFSLLIP
jgi:hypothetical protein